MNHALKEWAVICKALAEGRQAIILRKGGVAENAGEFGLAQTRFWLYPTYVHQQQTGIRTEAVPLLEHVEAERPPGGVVRLSHFAEVEGVYHVHDIVGALKLTDLHLLSLETVEARFQYRAPGLFVIPLRVYRAAEVHEIAETSAYAGCKSWVTLEQDLPTDGAIPVLDDQAWRELLLDLDRRLNPIALA